MIDPEDMQNIIEELRVEVTELWQKYTKNEKKLNEIVKQLKEEKDNHVFFPFPSIPERENKNDAKEKRYEHWEKEFEKNINSAEAPKLKLNKQIKRIFDLAIDYHIHKEVDELTILKQSAERIVDLSIMYYRITKIHKCTLESGKELTDLYRNYFETVQRLNQLSRDTNG
jgi:hypothetical protein